MKPEQSQPSTTRSPPQLNGVQILLVEDDKLNQIVTQQLLESYGALTTLANNGLEAVEAAKHQLFDLVLMDIQMPKLNGYQATEEIRKEKQLKDLPIIAMTALAMTGERERCLAAGMNDYFSKPFTLDELQQLLIKWIAPPDALEESARAEIQANLNKLAASLDKESILTSLDTILNCVPERLASLTHALTTNDRETAKKQAHKLRGSLNMYGTEKLALLLEQIENEANAESETEQIIQRLNSEFDLALKWVGDMRTRSADPDSSRDTQTNLI